MKDRSVKAFFAAILVIVIVCGCAFSIVYRDGKKAIPAIESTVNYNESNISQQEQSSEINYTVKFLSVGDNLIHEGIYEQARKRASGNGYDFSYCYENIAEAVNRADIATINQETVFSSSNDLSGYPQFNSPHEVGDELARIGFDVVTMANNHMLDQGENGLRESIEYWDSVEKVTRTGAYLNDEDFNRVEYVESNGLKIGLVSATQYTNGLSIPSNSELRFIYTSEEDLLENKIRAAKAECDVVLVNVHWGVEYDTKPTSNQRELAEKMSNWGADVIIGHHPHVLEPIEFIERSDGTRTLVAYSLGNFISQQNTPLRTLGGMIEYKITKDKDTNALTIDDVKFIPIVTHYVSGVDDVKIYQLNQYSDSLASGQASRLKCDGLSVEYYENELSKIIEKKFLE